MMRAMKTTLATPLDDEPAMLFCAHLQQHAEQYFTDLRGRSLDVQLVTQQTRLASRLYRYLIYADDLQYSVLIKLPPAVKANGQEKRPSMAVRSDPQTKHFYEYTTLSAIENYFESHNDPRFGVVKALDFLPDHAALIMEELHLPTMRRLFHKTNRLQQPFYRHDLRQAFHNAGAWLRLYHALPREAGVQVRHATQEDFVETLHKYTSYLGRVLRADLFFQSIVERATQRAHADVPQELPLGLGHGDYAMRNILVGDNSRVTVLDMVGRWRVPIYEDIGYYLVRLKAAGLRVFTLGYAFDAAQIAEYEQQFLNGYFGDDDVPYAAVRLFEIQALLDNWSAHVAASHHARRAKTPAPMQGPRLALINRFFRKYLCELIDQPN